MPFLSPQSIEALAEVISGGSASFGAPEPIGLYRSGPALGKFMRSCNVDFNVGSGSRVPSLVEKLIELNESDNAKSWMTKISERAADPRDFVGRPEVLGGVIRYLNERLIFDGLELRQQGINTRLVEAAKGSPVVDTLAAKVGIIDFDTVNRDLERALESAEKDPEDAVTAACSVIESVCRSILVELKIEFPSKKDIQGLYKAVRAPLGLAPDRADLPSDVADDIRKVLSGLATVVEGIGSLRTHAGDAHGRERGYTRLDPRIARLAIHSASTVTLFLIETWEKKYPNRALHDK